MAGRAIYGLMRAFQNKCCFVVIKLSLAPFRRGVAALALFAQPTAVRIGFFVTAKTSAGCLAKFFAGLMATAAGNLCVPSFQFEIGARVIEGIAVETNDIGVAAFVIGVTLLARRCFVGSARSNGNTTVKAGLRGNVGGNVFVTIETEFVLCLFGKRDVALIAVGFELSVPLYQLSRHQ